MTILRFGMIKNGLSFDEESACRDTENYFEMSNLFLEKLAQEGVDGHRIWGGENAVHPFLPSGFVMQSETLTEKEIINLFNNKLPAYLSGIEYMVIRSNADEEYIEKLNSKR